MAGARGLILVSGNAAGLLPVDLRVTPGCGVAVPDVQQPDLGQSRRLEVAEVMLRTRRRPQPPVTSCEPLGLTRNRGRLHADPVRRGAAAGRGEHRARWRRSSRGPMRGVYKPAPSAMSSWEVGWRRNSGDPAEAAGSKERSLVTMGPRRPGGRSRSATGPASRSARAASTGGVRDE